jgi:hypothetical protein
LTAFQWHVRVALYLIFGGLIATIGGLGHLNSADYLTAYGIAVSAAGLELLTTLVTYASTMDAEAREQTRKHGPQPVSPAEAARLRGEN